MAKNKTKLNPAPPSYDEAAETVVRALQSPDKEQRPLIRKVEREGDDILVTMLPSLGRTITVRLKVTSTAIIPFRPRSYRR